MLAIQGRDVRDPAGRKWVAKSELLRPDQKRAASGVE